jgi:hypothetical protein
MAYTYTDMDNGELYVEDESKGLGQTVPNVERPYSLVYFPSTNNVYAVKDLSEVGDEPFQHIKVVK